MALDKTDLEAIRDLLREEIRPIVQEEIKPFEKRIVQHLFSLKDDIDSQVKASEEKAQERHRETLKSFDALVKTDEKREGENALRDEQYERLEERVEKLEEKVA